MSDARKPTYDQLSALCAQMAAALGQTQDDLKSLKSRIQTGSAAEHLLIQAVERMDAPLAAHRTLLPDPQWQRVPEDCVVMAVESVSGMRIISEQHFKWARFIVQHKPEYFLDHACKGCVPEGRVIVPGGDDFICAYHEAVALLEQSEEGRAILNRARRVV